MNQQVTVFASQDDRLYTLPVDHGKNRELTPERLSSDLDVHGIYLPTYIHANRQIHTHTYTHSYTYNHTYMHSHEHTHTHTQIESLIYETTNHNRNLTALSFLLRKEKLLLITQDSGQKSPLSFSHYSSSDRASQMCPISFPGVKANITIPTDYRLFSSKDWTY